MIDKHKECAIVSDLLPLYVERRTGEECNIFIRGHLEQCEDCRKEQEFMKVSYEELLDEGQTGDELSENCCGLPRREHLTGQGKKSTKRGRLSEDGKMMLKRGRGIKWKRFVIGYVLLLAGIWLYLIFGLFWGVM